MRFLEMDHTWLRRGALAVVWCLVCGAGSLAQAQGLMGFYYDGTGFGELQATRVDPFINFEWNPIDMPEGMSNENFSVRWVGRIFPRYAETYEIIVTTDDGMRLWVDGQLLVDTWMGQGATEYTGQIALRSNRGYDIMLEYYQGSGGSHAQLEWASASQVRETISEDRMEPSMAPEEEPVVRLFTSGPVTGERAADQGKLLVTRFGDWSQPLEVALRYEGDAEAGVDFSPLPEVVTLPAGRTSVGITVSALDDAVAEPEESVTVTLEPGEGYTLGAEASGTVVIQDNDSPMGPEVYSVVGRLEHGGTSAGHLVAVVWADEALSDEVQRATLVEPGIYSIAGLEPGRYYVSAFLDEDQDGVLDEGEPSQGGVEVDLPPDALAVDFDFTPGCDEPNAPATCGQEPDMGGADMGAGQPDAGQDQGEGEGADGASSQGSGGCQQARGQVVGTGWLLLALGLGWLGRPRRRRRAWGD
jgi:hypothetical protein